MVTPPPLTYLQGVAPATLAQVQALLAERRLGALMRQRYPEPHTLRSDRATAKVASTM